MKSKNIKIATILPYKENYTHSKASAASLWVSEFLKKSKFKKNNYIFGSTLNKDYLSKNYINIELKSIKSKFKSTTSEYVGKLIKKISNKKFDIIEVHNRPLILDYLLKNINSKFIFYFHNDPLSMNGSKSEKQRLGILKNVEKIVFVSNWVQKRFFIGLDEKLKTKTEVVYPSVNKQKKNLKKKKSITFVGKLNESKGYDIYKDAIIKILNKYPTWQAFSLGDEERRKVFINHKNHKELGFLKHKKVLELLSKTEITIVPSRWEEPFGRTALEATSRGCATIVSNRGGLPETSDFLIKLKDLNSENLFKEIKKLIEDKNLRRKIQNLSAQNVKHLISNNTKVIDQIRNECLPINKFNFIKNKLKIINIYNQGQKLDHRLYNISLGKKFSNGFIRNGHDVLEISDRDFIKNNRTFGFKSTREIFQNHLIESFKNYNPDLLFFGHTKNLDLETIDIFKSINKNLIISQWNEDPIMPSLKYSIKNLDNLEFYSRISDHNFITTHPNHLTNKINKKENFHFFFVPVDKNIERYDVFNLKPKKDLFYAMSHGVNRAILKDGVEDDRINFLNSLVNKIPNVKFDFYGFANRQPIWGNNFFRALINSKMGLNLSRGKPTKFYSSNRIASIMGNGLLTFVDEKVEMNNFFNTDEMIFYSNINDLADKIKFYSKNDLIRKKIAKKGKKKYFKLFNEKRIAEYFINISIGKEYKLF
jgi:glycosyltransferase involved in cell wall biosynthesis